MKNNYVVKKVYRSFVLVSILTALTATLGILIDNIIVGRFLGVSALGAMGVVGPVSLILSAFSNICSGGGAARVSQALGRGQRDKVNNVFAVTMLFILVSGGLLTVFGVLFAPSIARLLGAHGDLFAPTTDYLRGYFLGAIPTILTSALMAFVKIDGSHRLPLKCIGVMTAVNIVLDLAMVLVFRLGMFGVALATSIAYCCAVLTALTHFRKEYCSLHLVRPQKTASELRKLITTGAPTAISRVCDTAKITLLNHLLVLCAGTGAVAALNVRTQAYNLVGALIMGVGQALLPIAGLFYGEEDKTSLQDALKEALKVGLTLCIAAGSLLLLFSSGFVSLLGVHDEQTLLMAGSAVRFFAVGMPLQLMNLVLMNFYQSTHSTGMASTICILQQLVFTTGFSLILVGPLGANGIWLSFLLGEACTLVITLVLIAFKNRALPGRLEDVMLLPGTFGGKPADRLELSAGNSLEDVVRVCRTIRAFAQEHSIEGRLLSSLIICIEELAGNVVRHAFIPGKSQYLDVVILCRSDRLIIRMRDNGALFDPITYLRTHPDDGHLGILLAAGLADDITYRRSVGLNNLTVTLNRNS
ncbi:MAG: ATP-binding protein [Clostridia bacterium]|nr:ATP-binding protein [Clostridia bacterium]